MAQRHYTVHRPDHRPQTTAHLAQTMSLLEMNNTALAEKIQSELAANPALEMREDNRCPACGKRLVGQFCSVCSRPQLAGPAEPIVFVSSRFSSSYGGGYSRQEDQDSFESFTVEAEDLPMFVLNQVRADLSDDEKPIAVAILHGLDEYGFFTQPLVELAMHFHVPLSKVEKVRRIIQQSDPIGVGSQSAQEALIVQLEALLDEGVVIPPLTKRALETGYQELSKQKYRSLAQRLGIALHDVEQIVEFIAANLNPFPAHSHWGTFRNQTNDGPERYQDPDIIISTNKRDPDAPLFVQILWPIYGNLYVNQAIKAYLSSQSNGEGEKLLEEQQKATLLIKCLAQRNHTLVQLMQILADKQRDFILHGDLHSQPLTRAGIAEELGVHESTISRAVSSKTVQLPSGRIIPVATFFDRSLHIRTMIREMVEKEKKPLSDTKITSRLTQNGYNIARRTVAKYRAMEGIPPAHQRKGSQQS